MDKTECQKLAGVEGWQFNGGSLGMGGGGGEERISLH